MSDWKTPNEVKRDDAAALAAIKRNTGAVHDQPVARGGSGEIDPLELTGIRCWLRLANGWTVSISETDTPPAICCISAWRTGRDNLRYEELTLFDFGGGIDGQGRTDCRCWSFEDVREALVKIANAGGAEA